MSDHIHLTLFKIENPMAHIILKKMYGIEKEKKPIDVMYGIKKYILII